MKSAPASSTSETLPVEEATRLVASLQSELIGVNAKVASLEETIANLAHENQLLKRRLFGNKTERSQTNEMQLTLGDLLATEARLQKELDAAIAQAKKDAGGGGERPNGAGERPKPKGRRDLLASKLPRFTMEILERTVQTRAISSPRQTPIRTVTSTFAPSIRPPYPALRGGQQGRNPVAREGAPFP